LNKFTDKTVSNVDLPNNKIEAEIEGYIKHPIVINKMNEEVKLYGSLYFYKNYKDSYPLLTKIAKNLLTSTASSVPSEALFSKAGLTQTELRNRLTPDTLEKLVILKENI
jgi:hypothetical protein